MLTFRSPSLRSSVSWIAFGTGYDKLRAFRNQINNFSRAIRGEEELLVMPADGLASSEVIEAGYTALATGKWTTVTSARDKLSERPNSRAQRA